MSHVRVPRAALAAVATAVGIAAAAGLAAQSTTAPINEAANPSTTIENHFKLPAGRAWGSTSAVDIDKDGTSIWVAERCCANSCWGTSGCRRSIRC